MTAKNAEKILRKSGWQLVRCCGSHCQYRKVGCLGTATVPRHSGDLKVNILKSLEHQTGLSFRR